MKKRAERAEKGLLGSHRNASDKTDRVADDKQGITNGEKFICYMCYETHDTAEDPLVAPCECRGDTRYLHVQCLQKWYHSSVCGPAARVIRTTGNGAPACKVPHTHTYIPHTIPHTYTYNAYNAPHTTHPHIHTAYHTHTNTYHTHTAYNAHHTLTAYQPHTHTYRIPHTFNAYHKNILR